MRNRFQAFAFHKCNLYRYATARTAGAMRMTAAEKRAGKSVNGAAPAPGGSGSHSSPAAGAIEKSRARRSNLATANAAVADPLGSALKKSSAAVGGGGAAGGGARLAFGAPPAAAAARSLVGAVQAESSWTHSLKAPGFFNHP